MYLAGAQSMFKHLTFHGIRLFKASCTETYDDWLATEGINNETEASNLKAASRKDIIKWIFIAWEALPPEMIKESFMHCTLSLPTDGLSDDLIHCFKEGQPYFQGPEVLSLQLMILQDEENSFENPSESDVKEAYESCQLLDQDEEDDEYIDIL